MKMNKQQLQEVAELLSKDRGFSRRYNNGNHSGTYGRRRSVIGEYLSGYMTHHYGSKISGMPRWAYENDVEDRDQLRRYLDAYFGIAPSEVNKYASIPDVLEDPRTSTTPLLPLKAPTPTPTPPAPEKTMTKPITITTKTFVNGNDISTLPDAEVYELIATQEAEIERLSKIKARPKKLVEELAKRQAGIDLLVAYLDSVKS